MWVTALGIIAIPLQPELGDSVLELGALVLELGQFGFGAFEFSLGALDFGFLMCESGLGGVELYSLDSRELGISLLFQLF